MIDPPILCLDLLSVGCVAAARYGESQSMQEDGVGGTGRRGSGTTLVLGVAGAAGRLWTCFY